MGSIRGQQVREVRRFYNAPAPQTITTGASTATSAAAFGTAEVLFTTTTDCFFEVKETPTASTADHFMPAGASWPVLVKPEDKVAVISPGGAGKFYISAIG